MEDDVRSVFTYEDINETEYDSFSLKALTSEANRLLSPKKCSLNKLAQGGFHKVYNIIDSNGEDLGVVAHVVATLKYIAEKTSVPVPKVIVWNSDATNEVGAEYMFLSKIPGVSAYKVWSGLTFDVKKNMVQQVAKYMLELWWLRFDSLGSLYLADDETGYKVGPIVDTCFYKKIDGMPRTKVPIDLSEYQGPFSSISSYLASGLHADLKLYAERREDLIAEANGKEESVESGKRSMEMALALCDIYPGDRPISEDVKEPITLRLDDFRLTNIMIEPATGNVQGLINFESSTTAPGWSCADIPPWLYDKEIELYESYVDFSFKGDDESGNKSGDVRTYMNAEGVASILEGIKTRPPTEEAALQKTFLDNMRSLDESGSWIRAYEVGRPYREFATSIGIFITAWGNFSRGRWIESALRWSKMQPNESTPGNVEFRYPDIVDAWK